MSLEDGRPPTQLDILGGNPLPSNDPSPAPGNATMSQTPHLKSTFQDNTATSRKRQVDGNGRTAALRKDAPRKPGVRRDLPPPKPPAKGGQSTPDGNIGKVTRKRGISDVDGAQKGPTAKNNDTAMKRQGIHLDPRFTAKKESPWQIYNDGYNLRVGGLVTVAARKRSESSADAAKLVAIKKLSGPSRDAQFETLRQVQGKHFVSFVEAYRTEDDLYIVLELMPISLVQIVAATVQLREVHVASIVAQVVNGIQFLESHSLVHGTIDCSTVLLNDQGEVKIGMQECCTGSEVGSSHADVEALADIMMQLLEKRRKSEDSADASTLQCWSPAARGFYHKITSQSATQLSQHAFLAAWSKNDLLILVSLAQVSSRRFYSVGF